MSRSPLPLLVTATCIACIVLAVWVFFARPLAEPEPEDRRWIEFTVLERLECVSTRSRPVCLYMLRDPRDNKAFSQQLSHMYAVGDRVRYVEWTSSTGQARHRWDLGPRR